MFRARLPFTLAFVLIAACDDTTNDDSGLVITGITVTAETLTNDHGCGLAPAQIFKYAAVVLGRDPADPARFDVVAAAGIYDCFADAMFVGLPSSGGSADYQVEVFAYDAPAYAAAGGDARLRPGLADRNFLRTTSPTFTTTCSGEQLDLVQALAVCRPLAPGISGVGPL